MAQFLIITGVFFVFLGLFVVCRNAWNGSTLWDWIREFLVVLAISAAIGGLMCLDAKMNEEIWNDGICDCGGQYELVSVTKSRMGSKTFYYLCDDCQTCIETSANMN